MSEMSPKSQSDDASGTDVRASRGTRSLRDASGCWPDSFTQGTDIAPRCHRVSPQALEVALATSPAGVPQRYSPGVSLTEENRVAIPSPLLDQEGLDRDQLCPEGAWNDYID